MEHRRKDFALMHCVAEYPTPDTRLELNQISFLKQRYPQVRIGYSTHERPDLVEGIRMAIAAGATMYEKHVGVPTSQFPLNAYSATPEQARKWVESARQAFEMAGVVGRRPDMGNAEKASLRALQRGAFSATTVRMGERIRKEGLFYAIPSQDGQITANELSKYIELFAETDIPANAPLLVSNTRRTDQRDKIYRIVQQVKGLLKKSGVIVPPKVDLEISHHYGIERFDTVGLTLITIVNRDYCKKLMILLPGQKHPEQYHKLKEETFHVLYGDIWADLNGEIRTCKAGDVLTVERGMKHSFGSEAGAIVEEISSTHLAEDSYYTDAAIMRNDQRKTRLTYWLD